MTGRIANYIHNLLKTPGRIKEVHEEVFARASHPTDNDEAFRSFMNDMRSDISRVSDLGRWAEYFSEVGAVNSATLLRRSSILKPPFHVVFLVHHIGAWGSIAPVIARMSADEDFTVTVASIGPMFRGHPQSTQHIDQELDRLEVPHIRMPFSRVHQGLRLLQAMEPAIIFRQSQWDADFSDAYQVPSLDFTRLCFIPYEMMNLLAAAGPETEDSGINSHMCRIAWRVYRANDLAKQQADSMDYLPASNSVVSGHPKLEFIREATSWWPMKGTPKTQRVLWSAHHSIDSAWTSFGLFHKMIEPMTKWAAQNPNVQIVLMMHPMLRDILFDPAVSPMSEDQAKLCLSKWDALPNTAIYEEADYAGLFHASDAMITDGLSMLIEYQIVNKPLVFVERRGHRPFNAAGKIALEGIHTTQDVATAISMTQDWLDGTPDDLADKQRHVVETLLPIDNATERIVDNIRAGLREEMAQESS